MNIILIKLDTFLLCCNFDVIYLWDNLTQILLTKNNFLLKYKVWKQNNNYLKLKLLKLNNYFFKNILYIYWINN